MKKLFQKNRVTKVNLAFKAKSKNKNASKNNLETNALLKNINHLTQDENFSPYYSKYGKFIQSNIEQENQSKQLKGVDNVQYPDSSTKTRPYFLNRKRLVKQKLDQSKSSRTLFISSINLDKLTKSTLENFFQQFGNVIKIQIPLDQTTSQHKNFGFIEFDDINTVNKLVRYDSVNINNIKLYIKKSTSSNKLSEQTNKMVPNNSNSSMNNIYGSYKLADDSPYNVSFLMNKLLNQNSSVNSFPSKFYPPIQCNKIR